MFLDEWKNEMILKTLSEQAEQGRLSVYCEIKKEFKIERYLSVILNLMRSYVAKLLFFFVIQNIYSKYAFHHINTVSY